MASLSNTEGGASGLHADYFDKAAGGYDKAKDSMAELARQVINFGPAIESTSVVLDNACGTGVITDTIVHGAQVPLKLHAADIAPSMLSVLQKKNFPNVQAELMDAQDLRYQDNMFTHSYTNLAIFLIPDSHKGAAEIYRTLKPGGTAILTSPRTLGWVKFFQRAQKAVRPDDPEWQGPLSPEWRSENGSTKMRSVVEFGGFRAENVKIETCNAFGTYESVPDELIAGMTQVLTGKWPEEDAKAFKTKLQQLAEEDKANPQPLEIALWVAVARK